jgi:hypothetical protein
MEFKNLSLLYRKLARSCMAYCCDEMRFEAVMAELLID